MTIIIITIIIEIPKQTASQKIGFFQKDFDDLDVAFCILLFAIIVNYRFLFVCIYEKNLKKKYTLYFYKVYG